MQNPGLAERYKVIKCRKVHTLHNRDVNRQAKSQLSPENATLDSRVTDNNPPDPH